MDFTSLVVVMVGILKGALFPRAFSVD